MKRIISLLLVVLLLAFASGSCLAALSPEILSYLALNLELSSTDDMIIFANYSESKDVFTLTAQIPTTSSSDWDEIRDSLKSVVRMAFEELTASVVNTLKEQGNYSTTVYTFLELSDGRVIDFAIGGDHYSVVD